MVDLDEMAAAGRRIELRWPGKDRPVSLTDRGWQQSESTDANFRELSPLVPSPLPTGLVRPSLFVKGERLAALSSLRRLLGRRAALIYADIPRVEGFDETRSFR